MAVVEVRHPLVQHHLSELRATKTPPAEFRRLIQRLAGLIAYEATHDLTTKDVTVQTPITTMVGQTLAQRIAIVPILRAGLGMVEPVLELLPTAEVWHLGMYRDEATAQPVEYYQKLPHTQPVDVAMVLDPMLATGGSSVVALGALARWGVRKLKLLSVIASRPGIAEVESKFPEAQIFVASVDPQLNDRKFIVPGLGDAGDRIFNTARAETSGEE